MPKSSGGLKELAKLNKLRDNLSIENLKHGKDAVLEYKDANLKEKQRLDRLGLNWVYEDIEMLPNSIVKLYNLQTLKLSKCKSLKELPKDINKLINLKFLEIDGCSGLTHMPNGLGQLTNLQTLSNFVISKGSID